MNYEENEMTLNECIDLVEAVYDQWEKEEIELIKKRGDNSDED